nr:zinc ribbon domain-containing protein [Desulfobulbaceae bacterium]
MPIYEYECQDCHNVIEVTQSIADEPKTDCPVCPGQLKKIISRSSFHLKGGGWYSDGYSDTKTACPSQTTCPAKAETTATTTPATCPKADGASCCAA